MFRIFSGLTLPCDTRRIRYDSYIDVMLQLLDPSILISPFFFKVCCSRETDF
jgi:hypothetical protein